MPTATEIRPFTNEPYLDFHREANAAANYNGPAPDGSRPGIFQIPLRPDLRRIGLRLSRVLVEPMQDP